MRREVHKNLYKKLKERDHVGGVDIDGKIILKWDLNGV
jgi:hypothetical protein